MVFKAIIPITESALLKLPGNPIFDPKNRQWVKEYLHTHGDVGHVLKYLLDLDCEEETFEDYADDITTLFAMDFMDLDYIRKNITEDLDEIVKDMDKFDASLVFMDDETLVLTIMVIDDPSANLHLRFKFLDR